MGSGTPWILGAGGIDTRREDVIEEGGHRERLFRRSTSREGRVIGKKRALGLIAVGMVVAMVGAACGKSSPSEGPSGSSGPQIKKGGVYRTAIEDFGFTGSFDPTGEYLGSAWGLYSDLLLRTLVTYNHIAGIPGDSLVPDLATSVPQPTDNGMTYTFTLKPGVKFGPPVNRPITSKDVAYAFQRINAKALVAQYGFYYDGVIDGMDGQAASAETPISGIETPDDQTIVFHLTKPTGDFLYRVAMPATAPVPPEVGKCFTKAGDYGRDIVSSGPYMIAGSDAVDVSSCDAIKPMSGFDPTAKLNFVRNPSYDASTDSPSVRNSYVDGVSITIDSNTDDIFNKIQAGTLDGSYGSTPPAQLLQQYSTDPKLKPLLHANSGDRTWYVFMNLLVPPFDDLHVRKAVSLVMPKAEMLKAAGGSFSGTIATHIFPPTLLKFPDASYDPYPSADHNGDLTAAKDEMKQSKYDSNGDGVCDSDVCKDVLFINRNITPFSDYTPLVQQALAGIGIQLKPRELDTGTAYTTVAIVKNLVPIGANAGWGKDYADPFTFVGPLFGSEGIICEGESNYSAIGMTADQAKECGVTAQYNAAATADGGSLPSIDSDEAACQALTGDARNGCWVNLDKKLMEQIVPWVPYRWANQLTVVGTSVTHWEFDQFSGVISFAHIAVNNGVAASTLS